MTTVTLPDKPSELIRVALADLRKCEAEPNKYVVEMDEEWHTPKGKICEVCLAGAVLAQTFAAHLDVYTDPWDYDEWTCRKLLALDSFRSGDIGDALDSMGIEIPDWVDEYEAELNGEVGYDHADGEFHAWLSGIADELEKHGL